MTNLASSSSGGDARMSGVRAPAAIRYEPIASECVAPVQAINGGGAWANTRAPSAAPEPLAKGGQGRNWLISERDVDRVIREGAVCLIMFSALAMFFGVVSTFI